MRDLAIERQRRSTVSQKISWALHRKRYIEGLIEDLTDLVNALVELAPAKTQQELCRTELAKMNSDRSLAVLDDVLHEPTGDENIEIDGLLSKCVSQKIEWRKGSMTTATWKRNKIGDDSTIRQGDHVASNCQGEILDRQGNYTAEDSEFGKNVKFHQGHRYGGPD